MSVRKLSLIIPVYGQAALLQKLLLSLSTTIPSSKFSSLVGEILILNDKPGDIATNDVIRNWNSSVAIPLYSSTNEKNLGFVGTVNRGFKLAKAENNLFIVNSDVEFFEGWLDELLIAMFRLEAAGTNWASITPCTNAGTIVTVPEMNKEYRTYPNSLSAEKMAFLSRSFFPDTAPQEIPVGVGFAMLMSREAFMQVGEFSLEFSPGYGEEVDWCLRASELGYKHFMAPSVFVHHEGGGSFSGEKVRICEAHQQKLQAEYPFYRERIATFIANSKSHFTADSLRPYASLLSLLRFSKVMIHALHSNPYLSVGGTEKYVLDTCNSLANTRAVSSIIVFPRAYGKLNEICVYVDGKHYASLSVESFLVLIAKLQDLKLLELESFTLQHAMHWPENNVSRLCEGLRELAPISNVFVHDFYPVCRQFNLLYNDDFYCGAPPDPEAGACKTCRYGSSVKEQRAFSEKLYSSFQRVILPSESARNIFLSIFPAFENTTFVVPHLRLYPAVQAKKPLASNEKPRIIFLGNTLHTKGIHLYSKLVERYGEKFAWTTIGISNYFPDNPAVDHIYYNFHEKDNICELLQSFGGGYLFLGSIWPETFSFTFYEALEAGLPVISFENGGNIASMIKKLQNGKVFSDLTQLESYLDLDATTIASDALNLGKAYRSHLNIESLVRLYTGLDAGQRQITDLASAYRATS